MTQVHAKRASQTLPNDNENARVLTGDDVQVSIFSFVVGMLRMLATVLVNDGLILNQLILLTEANVTVSV